MWVLGITDGISSGAAVVRDGIIVAAVNEERLSRLKMAYGFPRLSIRECLRLAEIEPSDIDVVTVATVNNYLQDELTSWEGWFDQDKGYIRNAVFGAVSKFGGLADRMPILEALYYKARWPIFAARRRGIRRIMAHEFGMRAPVRFINHHLAHATSAFYTSGFDRATVVTLDGGGDGDSSHIYLAKDNRLRMITRTSAFNSIGNYYAYVTHVCGYKAQKHEGKITGLAAHGKPVYLGLLNDMICFEHGRIINRAGVVFAGALKELRRRLPAGWTKEDLSASIQLHCERLSVAYAKHHLQPEGAGNVALAGGVFANVRINQEIHEMPGVKQTFVHPGMTDGGLSVGAALALCMDDGQSAPMPRMTCVLPDVYLGAGYTNDEIRQAIDDAGLEAERPDCIEAEIAHLLATGHVVARFDGKMEYGPRALGNRTIMYQPADRSVNDWLNHNLKRTEFMPFAPATMIERTSKCYLRSEGAVDSARFMTITFQCTDWMKKTCPGVVHLDGTARPQLVDKNENPGFYRIIEEFEKITGIPSIINTSFNMHEEPIVCSPADAIRAFQLGHLDYLVLGNYLIKSPHPLTHDLVPMPGMAKKNAAPVRT
ncbi:MAG: carbamoyltransferase [Phycisphaerales bacterium]|nr:carbamoyltransferase [Phycisphaerales bacterium]